MKAIWLRLLQAEVFAAGLVIIFGTSTLPALFGSSLAEKLAGIPYLPYLLLFVGVLVAGTAAFAFIPWVERFLRTNKAAAYLIPAQLMLLGVLLGVELALRLTVFNQPMRLIETSWFGRAAAPGSFYLWGREGYAITFYEGLPGEIRTPYRGGKNILLLGDSFMEGLQVSDAEKLASVAETILRRDGHAYDLHNLGESGRTMADYVAYLPGYRQLYRPAAIVLLVEYSDFIESVSPDKTNYFEVEGSKILRTVSANDLEGEFRTADEPQWSFGLLLLQYGRTRFNLILDRLRAGDLDEDAAPPAFDSGLAARQMELLEKARGGTPVILVLYPHAPHISGGSLVMEDPDHENLKTFLAGYPRFTVVDALPALQDLARSGTLPMGFMNSPEPGWGHFNAAGNEVIGGLIAAAVKEALR